MRCNSVILKKVFHFEQGFGRPKPDFLLDADRAGPWGHSFNASLERLLALLYVT